MILICILKLLLKSSMNCFVNLFLFFTAMKNAYSRLYPAPIIKTFTKIVTGKDKIIFGLKKFSRKEGYVARAMLNDINSFASPPPHCFSLYIVNARMNIIGNEVMIANVKLQSWVINEYNILREIAEMIRK